MGDKVYCEFQKQNVLLSHAQSGVYVLTLLILFIFSCVLLWNCRNVPFPVISCLVRRGSPTKKFCKEIWSFVLSDLNLKVLEYFFENFCYCKFKASFLKTSYFCLWEKIFEKDLSYWAEIFRICCSKQKVFHPVDFVKSYLLKHTAGFSSSHLTGHHAFSFWPLFVGVIFSQVSPGVPHQEADLISRCQGTIQL